MAVYKVIQDVEAEDKLVGPLTLKGFIYAGIAAILIFISVRLSISGAPSIIKVLFILLFLPPTLLFGILASPIGREQPSEVWLLSRVRFMLKPKSRIWDQAGIKNLVTVTAPKAPERILTKQISQPEVSSRLQALANTLDSRGWAIKNINVNLNDDTFLDDSERLASAPVVAPDPIVDVRADDDILDGQNNPHAKQVDSLIEKAADTRAFELQDKVNAARTAALFQPKTEPKDNLTSDEQALLSQVHARDARLASSEVITSGATGKPLSQKVQAAKLELARAGSDLSVATIAKLANRTPAAGEVSVELH